MGSMFRLFPRLRLWRQLKHGRTLAGTQAGQQHDPAVGEF
jgi:hypothetical protein